MTLSFSAFTYNFRAPGSRLQGPVRYTIGQAERGRVLIGRSQRGVCAILLGDDDQALCRELSEAFSATAVVADHVALRGELGQVVAFIDNAAGENVGKGADEGAVALDIGGSSFQQKIWQALCGIPRGQTRSYREVAEHLGVPTAARAVAGACAANVLAIAIPCHRVVRSDGSISGYRWGVERKRELLLEESEQ